jgi:hypothetical protein
MTLSNIQDTQGQSMVAGKRVWKIEEWIKEWRGTKLVLLV